METSTLPECSNYCFCQKNKLPVGGVMVMKLFVPNSEFIT